MLCRSSALTSVIEGIYSIIQFDYRQAAGERRREGLGETTQLKCLFEADLSNLVCVDVIARASQAQPLKVSCSLQVIHAASSAATNPSGRFCFLLWASWAVLGASFPTTSYSE